MLTKIYDYPIINRYSDHYIVKYLQTKMISKLDELVKASDRQEFKSLKCAEGYDDITHTTLMTYLSEYPQLLGIPYGTLSIINLVAYYSVMTQKGYYEVDKYDQVDLGVSSDDGVLVDGNNYRSYVLECFPGDTIKLELRSGNPNHFNYCFTEEYPKDGVEYLGGNIGEEIEDSSYTITDIPATAKYLVLYLSDKSWYPNDSDITTSRLRLSEFTSDLLLSSSILGTKSSVDFELTVSKDIAGLSSARLELYTEGNVVPYEYDLSNIYCSNESSNSYKISIESANSQILSKLLGAKLVVSQSYENDPPIILSEDNYTQYVQLRVITPDNIWDSESLRKSTYTGVLTPELIALLLEYAVTNYSNPYDIKYHNLLCDQVSATNEMTYHKLLEDYVVIPKYSNSKSSSLMTPLMESRYLRETLKVGGTRYGKS